MRANSIPYNAVRSTEKRRSLSALIRLCLLSSSTGMTAPISGVTIKAPVTEAARCLMDCSRLAISLFSLSSMRRLRKKLATLLGWAFRLAYTNQFWKITLARKAARVDMAGLTTDRTQNIGPKSRSSSTNRVTRVMPHQNIPRTILIDSPPQIVTRICNILYITIVFMSI